MGKLLRDWAKIAINTNISAIMLLQRDLGMQGLGKYLSVKSFVTNLVALIN
jgi:hypothetical protein